jgi:hypothetical protein
MKNIINLIEWTRKNTLLNERAENHAFVLRSAVKQAENAAREKQFESKIEIVSANKQSKQRRKKSA